MLERHAHLYEDEEGWGEPFAALVARVIAEYLERHDPRREAAWIAELDGERVGAVYCVRNSENVAQLRLLFVDSSARGHGAGSILVEQCIAFARERGYERMVLVDEQLAGERAQDLRRGRVCADQGGAPPRVPRGNDGPGALARPVVV